MSSHVGIRQLRADVAAAVRRAGAGENIVVTVGGRPVAALGPLAAADGVVRLDDLIARGLVIAPRRTGPWTPPAPVPVWSGSRIDRLLREIR
jgi:prevent-host-death family protein